ncbi:hypothetical protein MRX96_046520 [Rhipicephalus microplus]
MTGEVTGEPVVFARSSSSDCVALCASRLSQKCARATAARAQRGGKIVPSRPSGNDDASSIGGCSESSSRIDESPKPARPLALWPFAGQVPKPPPVHAIAGTAAAAAKTPLSEESVDGAELTEARPANETPSSTTCLAQSSEPPAPVPIQGQLELLLRNPDNTDTPRSSEMDSQSPSATQGYGGNEATGLHCGLPRRVDVFHDA